MATARKAELEEPGRLEDAGGGAAPGPGAESRRLARALRHVLLASAILAVWWTASLRISPLFVPSPPGAVEAFFGLLTSGRLLEAFLDSLRVLAIGYGLSVVVGVIVGIWMGLYRRVEEFLDIYVTILLVTPLVAVIPIVISIFGLDLAARAAVVFVFVVVFVIVNAATGVKGVSGDLIEMSHSFLLTPSQRLRWVILPSAAPMIVASLRFGFGRAVMGMLLGEMLVTKAGIGGLLMEFRDVFKAAEIFATVGSLLVFAVIGGGLILQLEKRVANWAGPAR